MDVDELAQKRGQRSIFERVIRPYRDIEHYYGDVVRQLFVGAALVICLAIPLWGDLLPVGTFSEIAAAILLVLLAGITSPHGKMIFLYNAIVAAFGALLLEVFATSLYHEQSLELFLAREAAAILLLFAFYYSVKTLRAMAQGKIGKPPFPWEFESPKDTDTAE